jgi:hypothetical protein
VALKDNLIAMWELEEASGSALDSHQSFHLTENGTCDDVVGKIGGARETVSGAGEYFSRASSSDLQTGDIDWSIAGWVYPNSVDFYKVVAAKDHIGTAREWILLIDQDLSSKFTFTVFNGTTTGVGTVQWGTAPSTSTWYYLAAGHSTTSSEVWISVNGGTPVTASTTGTPGTTSVDFTLGGHFSHNIHWDGRIDEFGFWKRDIRSDLAELYNSAAGLAFAEWDAGGGGAVQMPIWAYMANTNRLIKGAC